MGTRCQGCIMSSRPQEALQDKGRQSGTWQWGLREWAGLRAGAHATGGRFSAVLLRRSGHIWGHWESSGWLVPGLCGQERRPQQRPLAKAHRPQVVANSLVARETGEHGLRKPVSAAVTRRAKLSCEAGQTSPTPQGCVCPVDEQCPRQAVSHLCTRLVPARAWPAHPPLRPLSPAIGAHPGFTGVLIQSAHKHHPKADGGPTSLAPTSPGALHKLGAHGFPRG